MMSEFEDLVLEYEGGFPGSGPNWAAYEKMKARGKYLEEENARLRDAARWIPVEVRLPENNNAVLVTDGGHSVVEGSYVLGRWVAFSEGRYIHPTHWRPLPEPPEAE